MISFINIVLTIITAALTYSMFKLNKTMTKIAEDEKLEKTGHDLTIVLLCGTYCQSENKMKVSNFCIVNRKNKTEVIYRIFFQMNNIDFWFADKQPIVISPYSSVFISGNVVNCDVTLSNFEEYKVFAVTNDCTVELNKDINCFNKPLEEKED